MSNAGRMCGGGVHDIVEISKPAMLDHELSVK